MGRKSRKREFFYCPKCGKKKLTKRRKWHNQRYQTVLKCDHDKPGRRPYFFIRDSDKKEWEAKEAAKNPCDLVIEGKNGHDPKIEDYYNVLDKMAMVNVPMIQQWMFREQPTIRKKGLDVLYIGERFNLVRLCDDTGPGIWLYPGWTWEPRSEWPQALDEVKVLTNVAATYITFEDTKVGNIFRCSRFALWQKNNSSGPFGEGGEGKQARTKMIEWAEKLEAAYPSLLEKATAERARWRTERLNLCDAVRGTVKVVDFDGHKQKASAMLDWLPVEHIRKVHDLLASLNAETE